MCHVRPEEQEQWLSVRDLGIVLKELLVHLGMGKVKEEENGVNIFQALSGSNCAEEFKKKMCVGDVIRFACLKLHDQVED